MGSLHVIFGAHRDHEPRRVRSAGFRACGFGRLSSRPFLVHRTRKSGKPAGWKACATSRFMEGLHAKCGAHWHHGPRVWSPDLQAGAFGARLAAPNSWEGCGRLRLRRDRVSRPDRSLDLLQFLKIWFARVILVERVTAADQTVARGSCAVAEGTADELFLERAFLDRVGE